MFNKDFYTTPPEIIAYMLRDINVSGKTIFEPSAGSGNIIDWLKANGAASVLACEKHPELAVIARSKADTFLADDFLTVTSEQVSHIDMIVMNPPFSADERHILHAFEVAPAGCKIVSLCNLNTIEKDTYRIRRELNEKVKLYGHYENIGNVFTAAERKTDAEIGLIYITKPGAAYEAEFDGFFLDSDPDEAQANGIMPYNFIRDLVNRYVEAVKLFDRQLDTAVAINNLTSQFFTSKIAFSCTSEGKDVQRAEFKKDLQKQAWLYVFEKMNMRKYATKGLKEDINKFVEKQQQIPFTMRNIYHMIDIVIQTHGQRMDRALEEVFNKLTEHYHDNRFNVEGWKTNSHYLVNKKFILPHVFTTNYSGGIRPQYGWWDELMEDLQKALCYITGTNYDTCTTLNSFCSKNNVKPGQLYEWGFFEFRGFKKGTGHFTFTDQNLWALFNQHIARIKGFPLPESIRPK